MRKLSPEHKSVWLCIILETSYSGFWEKDFEYICFLTGFSITEEEVSAAFEGMYEDIGKYWFIPTRLEWSDRKGIHPKSPIGQNIYRDMVRVGLDVEKYKYLFQAPGKEFEAEIVTTGTSNGATTRTSNRGAINVDVDNDVAIEVDNDIVVGKSENNSDINAQWVTTNYPHSKIFTEDEHEQIIKLVDSWQVEVGFEKIKAKVLEKKTMTPELVSPLIPYLNYQLTESRK